MKNKLQREGGGGFTLLELLLSMAITAIIIGLIFGIFRVGLRAWERGERDIERQQRLRVVLELMKKQIASLAPLEVLRSSEKPAAFEGHEQRMSMISKLALDPRNRFGDVYSQYIVEETSQGAELFLIEEKAPTAAAPVDVDATAPETGRRRLLAGMHSILFQFLKPPDTQNIYDWQPQWDPAAEEGLPQAVKISIQDRADDFPIVTVIPVRSLGL
ncbi:MAG: hypothetical protein ACOZF0_01845 [Thermodesulfobacteriota bacterium]